MAEAKGLEGVVAAKTTVCSIDNDVLTYRGYTIDDLAEHAAFEEVVHLLLEGVLPSPAQSEEYKKRLAQEARLPAPVYAMLRTAPADAHPMAVLRTAVSMLAWFDAHAHDVTPQHTKNIALKLQAKIPTIIAAFSRLRSGLQPIDPLPEGSIAEQFLYMLRGSRPDATSIKALDTALVLHADHELNASTFAARVTVATLSDVYSGVTSAIGALRGPLHGGANEQVMVMLEEIGSVSRVPEYVDALLKRGGKLMGFGHRVYKNGDPRAKHLRQMSRKLSELQGDTRWYDMSVRIEEYMEQSGKKI
ncbi:MAG: citrate synthase, partial [Paenibacillaceae bacterium]|nr:citrate synthase [Paenibacillaceae bacterium]